MPDAGVVEDLYSEMCRHEFGRHAESVHRFLDSHRKRGVKREDPRREFNAVVGMIFNYGVLTYVRTALWQPLEEARLKKGLKQEELAEDLRVVPSTYSKIQAGATNVESILLF